KLKETLGKPRTDRYSASRGITGLRKAQAAYYDRRFGVKLNPETQIVATLGSKEGFANVAQAITAPGDVGLCPNPSYPIPAFGFLMAGGVIRSVPSEPTPQFFEAIERAIIHSIPKPLALVVCYPSNTTAYVASLDFYRDLVAFAKKHEIFILSDLAYAEVYFDDNNPPPSVLQVPGAIDVTVEFTSMSKTFSMVAWAPLPAAFRGVGSMQFATLMVEKSGVVVSPGVAFGEHGEGYVRIAMVENEQRIRQAARGVRRFLESGIETLHNVVPLANRR